MRRISNREPVCAAIEYNEEVQCVFCRGDRDNGGKSCRQGIHVEITLAPGVKAMCLGEIDDVEKRKAALRLDRAE